MVIKARLLIWLGNCNTLHVAVDTSFRTEIEHSAVDLTVPPMDVTTTDFINEIMTRDPPRMELASGAPALSLCHSNYVTDLFFHWRQVMALSW